MILGRGMSRKQGQGGCQKEGFKGFLRWFRLPVAKFISASSSSQHLDASLLLGAALIFLIKREMILFELRKSSSCVMNRSMLLFFRCFFSSLSTAFPQS